MSDTHSFPIFKWSMTFNHASLNSPSTSLDANLYICANSSVFGLVYVMVEGALSDGGFCCAMIDIMVEDFETDVGSLLVCPNHYSGC